MVMPSHSIHRRCADLLGIPGDVAGFVDRLIDLGECETHDVGVRHPAVDLGWAGLRISVVSGAETLIGCLKMRGRLDDLHLRAAALHFLLDCVDGKIKRCGTAIANNSYDTERVLAKCLDEVADKLRDVDMYVLPNDATRARKAAERLILPLYDIYRNKDKLLSCVALIAEENAEKGVEPLGVYTYYTPLRDLLMWCGVAYQWVKSSDYSKLYKLVEKLAKKKINIDAIVSEIVKVNACRNRDLFFAIIERAASNYV